MNIILEGPDATGKSTLAEKLKNKYNMSVINSTSKTRNDLGYHLDLLDYQDNTVFDRFHIGEMVYPKIYNREGKLTGADFVKITTRIVDNNDILIVFYTSNLEILNQRLIERGELDYLNEIQEQNELFMDWIYVINAYEYHNFYAIDISDENAYEKLDEWIDKKYGETTINKQYRQVCRDLLEKGKLISTKTGSRGKSYELTNYQFTVDNIAQNVVDLYTRNTSYTYLAGELLWYLSKRNDVEFISKFGKLWEKISDDGKTSNSAYGYILEEKFDFNQIETIIDLLKEDPSSRRAVLNINIPNKDVKTTKDEPCTICINYMIRDNELDCTVVMRSNDVIFGLTYDFTYFTFLQKYIAEKLEIIPGKYTHYVFSMHFYEKDMQLLKNIAYGNLESRKEKIDINNLLLNSKTLIEYIDNNWINKDEFENLLKSLLIIKGGKK